MERNRVTSRLRPRPYDLRRKVLLKNFFREQMTYIPHIRSTDEVSLDASGDSDFDENESNSNTNEGNVLTPKKVEDNIVTTASMSEPVPSTSNCCEKENSHDLESFSNEPSSNVTKMDEKPTSKFPRLSRIIETIDSHLSKKNRRKGIIKAKHELRACKSILKPTGMKTVKDTEGSARVKAKSFFERFKSRRDKKRNKIPTSKISNLFGSRNQSPAKYDSKVSTTSTKSVQTDVSWSPDRYQNIEISNISLRAENRLLSESLSSIIINTDFISDSSHNSLCTDSYTNSNYNSTAYNAEQIPLTVTNGNGSNSRQTGFSGTRILRSKSMQDEKRSQAPSHLRTRSFNFRDIKRPYTYNAEQIPLTATNGNGSNSRQNGFSGTRILRSKSMQNEKRNQVSSRLRTRSFNFRDIKRPYTCDTLVANEPYHSKQGHYKVNHIASTNPVCAKTRLSILQRIDASPLYNTNTSSTLRILSNKSGKTIIRRSSMPEKVYSCNNQARPIKSSSMRESNCYSRVSSSQSSHRRSNSYKGYPSSVPFQDLPAETFY
ncbi:uncharacterized protein LOC129975911 [Argiope bruennichi]|uniref:uncharacterized protein LOC129975911 n=1 Tax=Argiope bruennichi TaxID=94029 RepID=UPI002494C1B5|nr:uncharacterized protein LOC129975911 [Argiope bruennichi]